MLKRAAAAALAGFFALACGCGGGNRESPAAQLAAQGVLRRGNGAEPESLDPHFATSVSAGNILLNLFEGLVRLHPETLTPEPAMAERWEISEDGRVYTFFLREAFWSDGAPLRAEDFVFAFRRLLHPELGAAYAAMLFPLRHARAVQAGERPPEQLGVEAVEARVLRLELEAPTPYLLALLAHWTAFPLPEHALRARGGEDRRDSDWTRPEHLVVNGPFTVTEWRSGERLTLRRNPRYWQAASVRLNGAEFIPFTDPGAEERAFRSGEIHLTYSLPRHRLTHYRETNPEVLRVDPYLESVGYAVNFAHPVLTDPRVRRALSLALDRRALTEHVLLGVREPAFTYVPPGTAGFASAIRLEENLEEARTLLAEAGFPGGAGFPELRLIFPSGQDTQRVAEAVQQLWLSRLGLRIRLENLERQTYFSRRRARDFDLCQFAWVGDFVDPMTFLGLWTADAGHNLAGWREPVYDRLLADSAGAGEGRLPRLAEAERVLLEALPILPLYFGATQYLKQPAVRGWHANLLDWHPLRAVDFDPEAE